MKKGSGNWFEMPKSDFWCMILILLFCLLPFGLVKSQSVFLGVSTFGWIMGLLMFLTPVISLAGIAFEKREN
jgi:hypothetical protein